MALRLEELNISYVIKYTLKYFIILARSKIIVINAFCSNFYFCPPKKNQVVIQTFHSSLGIKRIGTVFPKKNTKRYFEWILDSKYTNYCISNSNIETYEYTTSRWGNIKILELGNPKNDILVQCDPDHIKKTKGDIFKLYDIPGDTKICLYGPTFRSDGGTSNFDIDSDRLREALKKRFSGNWIIFSRLHHHTKHKKNYKKYESFERDVTDYQDIQELILIADVGITDYSSWIFDFVLTRRPGFIYARDIESYERGFLYPLTDTPFPIAANNDELEANIISFDESKYKIHVENFLIDKGCKEDGHASEKTVELIRKILPSMHA